MNVMRGGWFQRILAGLDRSELARLAKVHITTIVRLVAFNAQQVRGQSRTITAVVNALAKPGIELGKNGSVLPRPKGKDGTIVLSKPRSPNKRSAKPSQAMIPTRVAIR